MQEDTGSDISLIQVNFWPNLGKQMLKKSTLQQKQLDSSFIKRPGTLKGTFETKNRLEIIHITVVVCTKDHGLLGIDVLKVVSSEVINSMELEKQEIRSFKGYKTSIRLKEIYQSRYIYI